MPQTHIVGVGLAGLAAAVSLALSGHSVRLYEASRQAGGRCRSFFDDKLHRTIDNGNHLLLSGNTATMKYLSDIGSSDELIGPEQAEFHFFDVRTKRRWCLRPSSGRIPWWLLNSRRRVPDTRIRDYLSVLRLVRAGSNRTVTDCVGNDGVLFERFWEPLATAVLNTSPDTAAANLLWSVMRESFLKGGSACIPRFARRGLSAALVTPALTLLSQRGAEIRFTCRLRRISMENERVTQLVFANETVTLEKGDMVVLATPPDAAAGLLPWLKVPRETCAIVNVHFVLPEAAHRVSEPSFVGLTGGTAQWVFFRSDIASITVSAADHLAELSSDEIGRRIWTDLSSMVLSEQEALPDFRVVKEKRATIAQTPMETARRPKTRTQTRNLYLAGDWTDTGLAATIEGAVLSGNAAARAVRDDVATSDSYLRP